MNQLEESSAAGAPLALVNGKAFVDPPSDLYIPSQAMRVLLETFEGPLDLLLYLIRRRVVNILELSISKITSQYMEHVEMIRRCGLEFLAEYLAMAAWLAEIKSRLLLPQPAKEVEDRDPRAELMHRLLEYKLFRKCGEELDMLCREERDVVVVHLPAQQVQAEARPKPDVSLTVLPLALQAALNRRVVRRAHRVEKTMFSTRERMTMILALLAKKSTAGLNDCFEKSEGKRGLITAFLGILELTKSHLIETEQEVPYAPIRFYRLDG